MEYVQKVALQDSFDARGVFIPAGHLGTFDADKVKDSDKHLIDPGDIGPAAMVQIAPIGPTGPNPVAPQQVPPGAVQTAAGTYMLPGKNLVAEVTRTAEARIEQPGLDNPDREAEVDEALRDAAEKAGVNIGAPSTAIVGTGAENNDDALVAGTAAEVTADLGTKTDAELNAMRAAEIDRERPRKGVLNALDAELKSRQNA